MTKPDFIIIGAMKCATSTLHSQLALQPGIFMSTPKEPNFFSDDQQFEKGEKWYYELFADAKLNDLCGESSTHYTKLPEYPLTIERMVQCLKEPKFIYVMRHPVDRLVSHYIHLWSMNEIKCDINKAIDDYEELIAYSCYARQLQPYFEQFGRENVLPVFMEAIKMKPKRQLQRVADFIGYQGEVQWSDNLAPQNISRERIRPFFGYSWLIESSFMTSLRRGLITKSFRNRIKKQLTMQDRPRIDSKHLVKITEIFDRDLVVLGKWLGWNLNCYNYSEVVIQKHTDFIFKPDVNRW